MMMIRNLLGTNCLLCVDGKAAIDVLAAVILSDDAPVTLLISNDQLPKCAQLIMQRDVIMECSITMQ